MNNIANLGSFINLLKNIPNIPNELDANELEVKRAANELEVKRAQESLYRTMGLLSSLNIDGWEKYMGFDK